MYNFLHAVWRIKVRTLLNAGEEMGMRNVAVRLLVALSMTVLFAGGCAKKEVMKSEETVVPKAPPVVAEVAKPAPVKPVEVVAPATPVAQAMTKPTEMAGTAISRLEAVYFDYDRSDLRQDARDVLNKNAETLLKSRPDAKIQVEGHCDERGSAEYNLALGERRAKSSLQYLITLGVKADRLSIISYGKEKPAVKGSDEAAWAKNRRAEFVIK